MIRIAICDDNKSDIKIVEKNIRVVLNKMNIPFKIVTFMEAGMLLNENRENPFDVIFLDIDMPQINGMEAAAKINEQNNTSEIVFVTNHDELVYKAFKFKALGFVRKKYLETEIEEITEILIEHINQRNKYMIIRGSGIEKKINIKDIIYMQSDDHYVDIFTVIGKKSVRKSLNDIEAEYSVYGFIRIHARCLVNYRYIYSIEKNTIILKDKKQLPLSRSKANSVKGSFQFFSRRI